jgi:hypothetical protein
VVVRTTFSGLTFFAFSDLKRGFFERKKKEKKLIGTRFGPTLKGARCFQIV